MIFYVTSRQIREASNRHHLLTEVMHDLDLIAERYGWNKVVVTSIYRTLAENRAAGAKSLVHVTTPHRAADIRTKDIPKATVDLVVREINALWAYDPTRPRYLVADARPHGTGPHIHLQVHPNTRRKT